MNQDFNVFGHSFIQAQLDKVIATGQIFHAYSFIGQKGVGKKTLAYAFASKFLGKHADTHPDFGYFDADNESPMEMLRDFLKRTSLSPVVSRKSIYIIDNADSLRQDAANVLLKTFEEPAPSSVLMLISHRKSLPGTIYSRSQNFSFQRLSPSEMNEFCKSVGVTCTSEEKIISAGSPGRLLKILEDKNYKEVILPVARKIVENSEGKLFGKMSLIPKASELETEELKEALLCAVFQIREKLTSDPSKYSYLHKVLEAVRMTDSNINKKLILQSLALT